MTPTRCSCLIARKYDGSANRSPGRPPKSKEIQEMIVRMAGENVGRTTVRRIMLENGLDPAPQRSKGMPWKTFLKIHTDQIAGADFLTIEVMTLHGLVRYHVLFVMELATRKVALAGIASNPSGEWMKQVARNLTDACDGFLKGKRHMLHDRDPLFTDDFREILTFGTNDILLRIRAASTATDFVEHYHQERNHQGLENRLIESANDKRRRQAERLNVANVWAGY